MTFIDRWGEIHETTSAKNSREAQQWSSFLASQNHCAIPYVPEADVEEHFIKVNTPYVKHFMIQMQIASNKPNF